LEVVARDRAVTIEPTEDNRSQSGMFRSNFFFAAALCFTAPAAMQSTNPSPREAIPFTTSRLDRLARPVAALSAKRAFPKLDFQAFAVNCTPPDTEQMLVWNQADDSAFTNRAKLQRQSSAHPITN